MRRNTLIHLWCLIACCGIAVATRTGDEDFGAVQNGTYYVFANKAIHVISQQGVLKNITADQNGNLLTSNGSLSGSNTTGRTWNDVAYVQNKTSGGRYVFGNEADLYASADGNTQWGYVTAIDASAQQVVARIRVGARPVHIYSINQTSSIWTHSDAEGTFYVIPTSRPTNLSVATTVKAYTNTPGHGKLVINNDLYPIGYGTNVNEQIIPKFNIANTTNIGGFPYNGSLSNSSQCIGTHTIVYSRVNKHLLIECIGGGGILEWNTANDTFVAQHNVTGTVTGAPGDDLVFVGSNTGSQAIVIMPGANGKPSTVMTTMRVPYNPDYPAFWSSNSNPNQVGSYSSYTVYFPLTRNTNLNNVRAAGNNVTTLAYMVQPSDCQYSSGTVSASSLDPEDESPSSSSPGLTLAAAANGSAITPTCGACAPGINTTDPSQFNASLSGLGVFNLSTLSTTQNATTQLVSAGATLPSASSSSGAAQCSFSTSNHRAVKRGGNYIATVATLPSPSVFLVNAASGNGVMTVLTAANPQSLAWVPNTAS